MEKDERFTRMIDVNTIENSWDEESDEWKELFREPALCIRKGGLVAFPTETVYGLGADALNESASRKIYEAKGRPSDNPLIVHIADVKDLDVLGYSNEKARMLAEAFWPGPLTIVLPKKNIVPKGTTGGLDTVAIRMPSHPAALALIRESGKYIAAPSANTSGRPSPTKASHVREDLEGKIDFIIDGGTVGIGIESTIIDVTGAEPTILRPGFITKEMLEDIIGKVKIDPALENPGEGMRPKAPGMKYTHYAPKGELTLVEAKGDSGMLSAKKFVAEEICRLVKEKREAGCKVGIMAPEESILLYEGKSDCLICVGNRKRQETVAARLYTALREFDEQDIDYIYAESFSGDALSGAIMNRLLKAAGHRVIYI